MTPKQQQHELAAIRERYRENDCKTYAYTVIHKDHEQARKDVRFLLERLDEARRERQRYNEEFERGEFREQT